MWWRFWNRKRRDEELEEEIAHDLFLETEDLVQSGMPRREAEFASRKDFGNVLLVKETTREAWSWRSLETLAQDLLYAARTLRRSPGFAATSILAVALGVGVNSAIFTIFDQIAFRPLPVKDGDRIVGIYETFHGQFDRKMHGNTHMLSYAEFQNFQSRNRVFSEMAAYAEVRRLTLAGLTPEAVSGVLVTRDYFKVLGGTMILGREFVDEELSSPRPVAILSNAFWQHRFGGDPAIIGKAIRLNQTLFTIVGVTAPGFLGTTATPPQLWLPLSLQPVVMADLAPPEPQNFMAADNLGWLSAIGKLKPGIQSRQARAGLQFLAAGMDAAYPGRITEVGMLPSTFLMNPDARTVVLIGGTLVMAAVGLVLFVACANVANLLLVRATLRQREIAIRLSIGATRGRLIRQLLTESTLLAFLGAFLGLLSAQKALAIGGTLAGVSNDLSLNAHVLAYALLLAVAASLMFGLVPALQATSPNLSGALKEEGSIVGRRFRSSKLRNRLVTLQVAICCILLVGAGLLVRGLINLNSLDPGFYVKRVFLTSLDLRLHNYGDVRAAAFYRELLARIDSQAGVQSALAAVTPLSGVRMARVRPDGEPAADGVREANFNIVSPNYFDVLGIRLIQGRNFTEAEADGRHPVAIVNEAMARAYWPGQNALGKRFLYGPQPAVVIGVATDVRSINISRLDGPFFYLTMNPNSQPLAVITRSADDRPLAGTIQQIVRQLDPTVLSSVHTMEDNLEHETSPTRLASELALLLGLLSLALAAVGIYGVTAYVVSQRTHEIGVRMALGAGRSGILRWMISEAMRPVCIGIAIGLPLAAAGSLASSSLLLGVRPLDPVAFLAMAAFLAMIALIASWVPARRATRVDPMIALHYE